MRITYIMSLSLHWRLIGKLFLFTYTRKSCLTPSIIQQKLLVHNFTFTKRIFFVEKFFKCENEISLINHFHLNSCTLLIKQLVCSHAFENNKWRSKQKFINTHFCEFYVRCFDCLFFYFCLDFAHMWFSLNFCMGDEWRAASYLTFSFQPRSFCSWNKNKIGCHDKHFLLFFWLLLLRWMSCGWVVKFYDIWPCFIHFYYCVPNFFASHCEKWEDNNIPQWKHPKRFEDGG